MDLFASNLASELSAAWSTLATAAASASGDASKGADVSGSFKSNFGPYEWGKRVVICGFPSRASAPASSETFHPDRSLPPLEHPGQVRDWLKKTYSAPDVDYEFSMAHAVVWNLSGKKYDYESLGGQIVEYDFPSRPVPPLVALRELAEAVRTWVKSDERNVAVLHDISGRRAVIAAACAFELLLRQQSGETSAHRGQVLGSWVLPVIGRPGDALVPSQRRYYTYFLQSLDKPSAEEPGAEKPARALWFRRIIVNGVPAFERTSEGVARCRPRLRVVDGTGAVLYNSSDLPEQTITEQDVSFSLALDAPSAQGGERETVGVQGDFLVRVSHAGARDGQLSPMFAFALHTDYLESETDDFVVRLEAKDLDGAAGSARFPKDFFIDAIFSTLDPALLGAGGRLPTTPAAPARATPIKVATPPPKIPAKAEMLSTLTPTTSATLAEIDQALGDELEFLEDDDAALFREDDLDNLDLSEFDENEV